MSDFAKVKPKFIHKYNESVEHIALPFSFTYPFFYEPHPLALLAARQIQHYLNTQNDFNHNFGFESDFQEGIGKMFGVLVVKDEDGELAFLAGFSGKLANSNNHKFFVPPIFDLLDENGFFLKVEEELNEMNREIEFCLNADEYIQLKDAVHCEEQKAIKEIEGLKRKHKLNKKQRDTIREKNLTEEKHIELKNQSIADSYELKKYRKTANESLKKVIDELYLYEGNIEELKKRRKEKSNQLQQKIFQHYKILNSRRESKDLIDVFDEFNGDVPPAGSGECAAPKLLNYAYLNNLQPICMAEFWWGRPPSSAVRKHRAFYPACRSKCEPILNYMLQGLNVEDNPIAKNYGADKEIQIVYEDDELVVVNKPEGLLSVPGKQIKDSVFSRLKESYPDFKELLLVHRLDMSTSGLIVVAKNLNTHKYLQRQFIKRQVFKRYVAILDGTLNKTKGVVDLPMRVDLDNRPRQLICYDYGKQAVTEFEVVQLKEGKTRIHFYPKTGRTHQLRLHAAHKLGLNCPILGDDLYGMRNDRLYLHAEEISFVHPKSRERVSFIAPADF